MKRWYVWCWCIFVSTTPILAQEFRSGVASTGFGLHRLSRADSVVNAAVKAGEIPGAVALVIHRDCPVLYRSYGYADIASGRKMESDAIFRIASMTKAITTVAVMILYEQGHFLLNDPVSKFIPEFKHPRILVKADSLGNIIETVPAKREIRIIDLLTHTSGISYPFIPNALQPVYRKHNILDAITTKDIQLRDQMKLLASLPLLFEPGSRYQYGLSADVLGYLCEVISGKTLADFFRQEIFDPLQMKDAGFYLSDRKAGRLVTLYSWDNEKKGLLVSRGDESPINIDNPRFPVEGAKKYFSGGGGLSATVHDYGRFVRMLLNEGELDGVRILSRKSVELMTTPRTDMNNDGKPDAGLGGLYVISDLGKRGELGTAGEYLGSGAFYGHFWVDPREKIAIVFMSQVLPPRTNVAEKFHTAVYQALK